MDKMERVVSFYDLRYFCRLRGDNSTEIAALTISEALEIAHEMWKVDNLSIGKHPIQITLDDWRRGQGGSEHHLIINRADASLEDIPLKDLRTRQRRMAGKSPEEGMDFSAHILIKLPANASRPATLLLTGGSSLQSADVGKYLALLFRQAKEVRKYAHLFRRDHPSGIKDKSISVTQHFALEAHPSAKLVEILKRGELEGLELVALADNAKLDTERTFSISQRALRLELVTPGESIAFKRFKEALSMATDVMGDDPDFVRLTYRPKGQRSQTATLPMSELENVFVKKDRVKFDSPILPLYPKIQPFIMDKLRQLL